MKTLPQQIEPDRLKVLVGKLKDNSITDVEKEEIIQGHIRLAFSIAHKMSYLDKEKLELFISEALYGLVVAVEKAKTNLNFEKNITPYIVGVIKRLIITFHHTDKVIRPKSKRKSPEVVPLEHEPEYKETKIKEIREFIDHSLKNELEKQVIELKTQGYTDNEIGFKLELTREYICSVRNNIAKRLKHEIGNLI